MAAKQTRTGLTFIPEGIVALATALWRATFPGGVQTTEEFVDWIPVACSGRVKAVDQPKTFQPTVSAGFMSAGAVLEYVIPKETLFRSDGQCMGARLRVGATFRNDDLILSDDCSVRIDYNGADHNNSVSVPAGSTAEISGEVFITASGTTAGYDRTVGRVDDIAPGNIVHGILFGSTDWFNNQVDIRIRSASTSVILSAWCEVIPPKWSVINTELVGSGGDYREALQYRVDASQKAPRLVVDIGHLPTDTVISSLWIRGTTNPSGGVLYVGIESRPSTGGDPTIWTDVCSCYLEFLGTSGEFTLVDISASPNVGTLPFTLEAGYEYRLYIWGESGSADTLLVVSDVGVGYSKRIL